MTSQPHPVRCWLFDGHERCAVRAAADHAENRMVWLRSNIDNPTPEAVAVALQQLHGHLQPAPPRKRRRGRRVITPEQRQEIRDLYGVNGGTIGLVTLRQLADFFDVSFGTVHNVIHADGEVA